MGRCYLPGGGEDSFASLFGTAGSPTGTNDILLQFAIIFLLKGWMPHGTSGFKARLIRKIGIPGIYGILQVKQ